jgi:diphosphomevalonate decarboxylase
MTSSLLAQASAPSNIALIKYMGKVPDQGNFPTNSSLSFTLPHLRSYVEIHATPEKQDTWQSLEHVIQLLGNKTAPKLQPVSLSTDGIERFLQHFQALKKNLQISGNYLIKSGNDFPADCGLASSASSFAALTLASYELAKSQGSALDFNRAELAELSRQGSGSSCRSFFGPFSLWYRDGVKPLEFDQATWVHDVVVLEAGRKEVSSSSAHQRVLSSLNFQGRPERAERRLAEAIQAIKEKNWRDLSEVCWAEFWDMHALFETSRPSFGYLTPSAYEVLQMTRDLWKTQQDGPVVTMDAGPNVHLLWRQDQKVLRESFLKNHLPSQKIYSSLGA